MYFPISSQISALVNLFGRERCGNFVLDRQENMEFIHNRKGAELHTGTTNCLKRQDALQVLICKCLLFSRRSLLQHLI